MSIVSLGVVTLQANLTIDVEHLSSLIFKVNCLLTVRIVIFSHGTDIVVTMQECVQYLQRSGR
jgi:hypothetical protein